jgi:phosphoribosylanthranilate isomerase
MVENYNRTTRIKVCRIRQAAVLPELARLGIDFAGLHLINHTTPEKLAHTAGLCGVARSLGIEPVLLTKIQSPEIVSHILRATGARWLQLHRPWRLDALFDVRRMIEPLGNIRIVHLISPDLAEDGPYISGVLSRADFVIIDHRMGGTGQRVPSESLARLFGQVPSDRVFLAGGLTASNVASLISDYAPYAIDVQSSVIGEDGEQDLGLVRSFVASARSSHAHRPT